MKNYKYYAIGVLLIITHSLVWIIHSWKDDSVKLAIEETRKATATVIAKELANQKVVQNNIYQKTIERTRSEKVYVECKNQPEMVELINSALR